MPSTERAREARSPSRGSTVVRSPSTCSRANCLGMSRVPSPVPTATVRGSFAKAKEAPILLDEIGEMPHKMQAGLLRVLQEQVVRPVGGVREERVSVRVIAATNRNLERMVADNAFREDLYYRLHVVDVQLPPLRERADDVPMLIDHFLNIFAARYRRERKTISRDALRFLCSCPWPGNVRQLENTLLNAWVMSDRSQLEIEDFEMTGLQGARDFQQRTAESCDSTVSHTRVVERPSGEEKPTRPEPFGP